LKKIVIIPTYNEKENIERICRVVMNLPEDFHLLVVDDSSPDGTASIVEGICNEFPEKLFLLLRKEKDGLGRAYIAGFKWALKKQYDYIFEMDADFSHNPDDLSKLSNALDEGADLSIGSRYVTGVNVVNWPMGRVLLSYIASKYVRFITGMVVRDTTAGFVGYKRSILENINLDKIRFKGYAFQIEMKYKAWKKGFIIKEVPIIFTDRSEGESKMSKGILREALLGVIELRVASILGRL